MVDQLCTSFSFPKYFRSSFIYIYFIGILFGRYLLIWILQRFETSTEVKKGPRKYSAMLFVTIGR